MRSGSAFRAIYPREKALPCDFFNRSSPQLSNILSGPHHSRRCSLRLGFLGQPFYYHARVDFRKSVRSPTRRPTHSLVHFSIAAPPSLELAKRPTFVCYPCASESIGGSNSSTAPFVSIRVPSWFKEL